MTSSRHDRFGARTETPVWSSLNRILITFTVIAYLVLMVTLYVPKYREQQEQNQKRDKLAAEIEKEEEKLRRGQREVELLKNDPAYVETIARDRLEVMKEGETIIRMETPPPARNP